MREARIKLVVVGGGDFKARLTWVELPHLHLLRSEEILPRIAYVSLAFQRVFVAFLTHRGPPQRWGGRTVGWGDIVLHGRGERMHQRTSAASRWGFVSLAPEHLASYGKAIAGLDLVQPPMARIIRPPTVASTQLLRLHAQACHLAETKPVMVEHGEVARALEQDLIHALVNCLTADDVRDPGTAWRTELSVMVRFEEASARGLDQPMRVSGLCAAIGVPDRTLRIYCALVLGMGPSRYLRLRRLNAVRAMLRHADPATESVAKIARRWGFSGLGRFAALYRSVFGETPSTTLRGHRLRARDAGAAKNA
jgi:AraC-like DNA-binding protein